MSRSSRSFQAVFLFICLFSLRILTFASDVSTVQGTIRDLLGAIVPNANVELLDGNQVVASATTDANGQYTIHPPHAGRYELRISASSFQSTTVDLSYVSNIGQAHADVTLSVETLEQQITVTATGSPTPQAQVGAAITVLGPDEIHFTREVQEPLRLVPGIQMTQAGQAGAVSSMFIRGGNNNYTKVLLDGVPADDIGGAIDFSTIASTGFDRIEVLREPNSALYGSDALAGVVNLTTTRGTTPLPEITYAIDGGNFGTYSQEGTLGGAYKQFDYFSDFLRFDTSNNIPNSRFHNATYAGNFGWNPLSTTSLRVTLRHLATAAGNPNAIQLYGIPDDAAQKNQDTYIGVTFENQTTDRWHNLLRYGGLRLRGQFTDYAPTGIPDPANQIFLGAPVTIRGANGYSVSGQALFQFAGIYPNQYVTSTNRDFVYAQSDYRITPHLLGLVGFKYEDERGYTLFSGSNRDSTERGNYSYTLQVNGDLKNRLFYTLGTGIENNAIFGLAVTPRASLAYYLQRPDSSHLFAGTKLRFSFGKGIKEPSIYYQTNSLYQLLLTNEPQLIAQYHVSPINAEWSRTYDGGIDQTFFKGRGNLGITYFHNEFTNVIEYVPQQGLVALGVPAQIAQATQFGAAVNSEAFRAQGFETAIEFQISKGLFARGGYTYLDAVVQRSFSSDAFFKGSYNPNFPTIPIGAFSPLDGARPFRRAPHSGYFGLYYNRARWTGSLSGTLVGRRDDSDFLSDANFGTTLLLPNRNLDPAYQRLDLSGSYQVSRLLTLYSSFQNILSEHYNEAFGYPALPFTFRSGIKLTFGGESWKLK